MEIPKEISAAVNRALKRLSMGDLTCGEMMVYLTDSRRTVFFPAETAEKTVCLLTEQGFLDDKRVLRLCVRHLDEKCFGPARIRRELTRRRFPPRFVEVVLGRNVDYTARAERLLAGRSDSASLSQTVQGRKKLQDRLVRYGYDYGTARRAVANFSREDLFSD